MRQATIRGRYAQIVGWGMALPQRVLTNAELEQMVDTSDEWIRSRTGIAERRIAGPKESTLSLATQAAWEAIDVAGVSPARVDLVIVCTFTPEFGGMPSVASLVQDAIGAPHAGAFDLNAACAGFLYGLAVAQSTIAAGVHDTVLLIGAETLSRLLDWSDRSTCVLFGDGAGAVLLQAVDRPTGLLRVVLGSDGSGGELLCVPAGGSRLPPSEQTVRDRLHYIRMNGREVYKFAVNIIVEAAQEAVQQAGLRMDQIDLFIPHQANVRIIDSAARALGLPPERVFTNVERYGNTSSASIPIALCEAIEQGRVRQDDHLVLVGFGGGLAWGAAVLQWGVPALVPTRGRAAAVWHGVRERVAATRSLVRRASRKLDAMFLNGKANGHGPP